MSHTHDTDSLFHFESFEGPNSPTLTASPTMPLPPSTTTGDPISKVIPSHDDSPTPKEQYELDKMVPSTIKKGKDVTKPILIRPSTATAHDYFDMAPLDLIAPSTSQNSYHSFMLASPVSSTLVEPSSCDYVQRDFSSFLTQSAGGSNIGSSGEIDPAWKGKEKELPPILPPLMFSPTDFSHDQPSGGSPPTIASPGPSSYASSYRLPATADTDAERNMFNIDLFSNTPTVTPGLRQAAPVLERVPSRRRSLSNLSVYSTQSLAARSISKLKLKLNPSNNSNNITRKLLFKKIMEPDTFRPDPRTMKTIGDIGSDASGIPDRWRTGFEVDELDSATTRLLHLPPYNINSTLPNIFPSNATYLRHKGRSKSSPFPLSVLDLVPVTSIDLSPPFPLTVRNYFDDLIPWELRLHILASLITLHQADHDRTVEEGRWSMGKASSLKGKWVGKDKGIRELVRLSRVSKTWQALVLDGQLWAELNFRPFPRMSEALILRLTAAGGPFATTLDIAGHVHLSSATLLEATDNLCVDTGLETPYYTQLTTINLQGCSSLTTPSLHHILVHSRSLQKLCVKGLPAVTNTTCDILSTYCSQLVSLDMSKCMNMDAGGIRNMAAAVLGRGERLLLKELRLCGMKNINNAMMTALSRASPYIEILDLSYARQLHNSALEAFVVCEAGDSGVDTVFVSPRDLGRESNQSNQLGRRLTRLRHLSMSFCPFLTDEACSNLAHSVPHLEFLEMAGIGTELRDDGLVRLLKTTPFIRRLDLEDASEITDSVLAAITPVADTESSLATTTPEPGHALEQLIVSYATNISDEAFLALIRGCTRLKCLEADNTRVGGAVLREFVRLCKERKITDAKAVVVDCRGITEPLVKELSVSTRPRMGWRSHSARKLLYLDARDGNTDELKVGQDECDEKRVVLKSFYSWQTVDIVRTTREKRRKAKSRRAGNESGSTSTLGDPNGRTMRWWSPGNGRRFSRSGDSSPLNMGDLNGDGCRIM